MPQIQMPPIIRAGEHTQQGIAGLQNAMAFRSNLETQGLQQNRMAMQNQDMAKEMQDRAELEGLLMSTPPEQRERAGLQFLKQRDPERAAKLEAHYLDRFSKRVALDDKGAVEELQRATGERIELGERYAKMKTDTGEVYYDKIKGTWHQVTDAKGLAELQSDLRIKEDKEKLTNQKELETHKATLPKTDQSLTNTELFAKDPKAYSAMKEIDAKTSAKYRAPRGGGGASGTNAALVKAVLENPAIFPQLTPTQKAAIVPDLHAAGFTSFGRNLSDTAIKEITQSQMALAGLKELKELVQDNKQYMGPIAGTLTAINPYSKGKQVQADIARVRQRVGRSLEGGVLRREDELKYKTILADIQDTDPNALYKIDQLITDVEREIELYSTNQKAAGRNVPERSNAPPPGSSRIVQRNKKTGAIRHSEDGGQTWQPGP